MIRTVRGHKYHYKQLRLEIKTAKRLDMVKKLIDKRFDAVINELVDLYLEQRKNAKKGKI